jgi:hypothetical protein
MLTAVVLDQCRKLSNPSPVLGDLDPLTSAGIAAMQASQYVAPFPQEISWSVILNSPDSWPGCHVSALACWL